MYLGKIQLENIKCFENLELDFTHGRNKPRLMTVILGDNGVGKTTLLQAIAIVLGGEKVISLSPGHLDNWVRVGNEQGEFLSDIYPGKSKKDASKQKPRKIHMSVNRVPRISTQKREEIEFIQYGYGPLRRFTDQRISEAQYSPTSRFASLFGQSKQLIPVEDWLLELDRRALLEESEDQPSKYRHTFNQLARTLLQMLPEEHFKNIETNIQSVDPSIFVKPTAEQGLLWLDGLGNWVTLSQLSDGYQSIMAWVGDLVSRLSNAFPEATNLLEQEGVVLIDEVDIHLHPTWQRKILDQLRETFPKIQFIVTTHSPLVAGGAKEGELFVLKRDQDRVIVEPKSSVQGWRADQILTRLFDMSITRDLETEQLLARYDELLAIQATSKLNTAQAEELADLENTLRQVLPHPGETAEQRQLYEEMQTHLTRLLNSEKAND